MTDIYEFRIRGTIGDVMRSALPELAATTDPPHSLLLGPVKDTDAVPKVVDELTRHDITITAIRINRNNADTA